MSHLTTCWSHAYNASMFLQINEQGIEPDLLRMATSLSAVGVYVIGISNLNNFFGKDKGGPQRSIAVTYASVTKVLGIEKGYANDDAIEEYLEDMIPGCSVIIAPPPDNYEPSSARLIDIYPDGDGSPRPAWWTKAVESLRTNRVQKFGPTLIALDVLSMLCNANSFLTVRLVTVARTPAIMLLVIVRLNGRRSNHRITVTHQGELYTESTTKKRVSSSHFNVKDLERYLVLST